MSGQCGFGSEIAADQAPAKDRVWTDSAQIDCAMGKILDRAHCRVRIGLMQLRGQQAGNYGRGKGSAAHKLVRPLRRRGRHISTGSRESDLRPLRRFKQDTPMHVYCSNSHNSGIRRRKQWRSGGSIISDGGNDEVASGDDETYYYLKCRVSGADQTDVDYGYSFSRKPGKRAGNRIRSASSRRSAKHICGVQLRTGGRTVKLR
jgi:hypothetical protein